MPELTSQLKDMGVYLNMVKLKAYGNVVIYIHTYRVYS